MYCWFTWRPRLTILSCDGALSWKEFEIINYLKFRLDDAACRRHVQSRFPKNFWGVGTNLTKTPPKILLATAEGWPMSMHPDLLLWAGFRTVQWSVCGSQAREETQPYVFCNLNGNASLPLLDFFIKILYINMSAVLHSCVTDLFCTQTYCVWWPVSV